MPAVAVSVAAFGASKFGFEIDQPLIVRPAFSEPGRVDLAAMAAPPAGHLEHMPVPQVTNADLVFRAERDRLKLIAFRRSRVSRYKNVPSLFSISQ